MNKLLILVLMLFLVTLYSCRGTAPKIPLESGLYK